MVKVILIFIFFLFSILNICYGQQENVNQADTTSQDQLDFQLVVTASKGDASTVLYLLSKGANVNSTSDNHVSALMYAAQNGHFLVVKTLVANGANVNYVPNYDNSALSSAVINNQLEIAEYLIRKGANVNIENYRKITPLMLAAAYGNTTITKLLLNAKADKSLKDVYGNDALIMSVLYEHPEVTAILLKAGANPNTFDNEKFSPLIISAQNGQTYFFEMLKYYKADFNLKNLDYYSALDMAVINKQPESILKLLQYDSIKNKESNNPVKLAYLSGNRELIPILRKGGCKPYFLPLFDKIAIGYGADASINDLMFGPTIGIKEIRYNFLFSFSYFSRFWAKRILVNYGNDMFIQFWERRSFLSFGLDKRFNLKRDGNKQTGIFIGLKEIYTYGHYRGAIIIPPRDWILMPAIGFYSDGKYGGASFNIEYVDFKMINVSPIRINCSAYIFIGLKKFNKTLKISEW